MYPSFLLGLLVGLLPQTGTPIDAVPDSAERFELRGANVREAAVPAYTLPPLPRTDDGQIDRKKIVAALSRNIFGSVPSLTVRSELGSARTVVIDSETPVQAVYQSVDLVVTGDAGQTTVTTHLFRPAGKGPFPCFVYLDHRSEVGPENANASRLDLRHLIPEGFALVAMPVIGIDPDDKDSRHANGIHSLVSESRDSNWSTLAAWAWGLSQTREAIAPMPEIGECFAIGHSRGGKTALWASAIDPEFAGVVSNNSGCGGAALSRREFGETVGIINRSFPHWFNATFKSYNDRISELPVDQHWLLAATAPRGLAVGSASDDVWADPYGEYLSLVAAAGAWDLTVDQLPKIGEAIDAGPLHYHLRDGEHQLTTEDWSHYRDWARRLMTASP